MTQVNNFTGAFGRQYQTAVGPNGQRAAGQVNGPNGFAKGAVGPNGAIGSVQGDGGNGVRFAVGPARGGIVGNQGRALVWGPGGAAFKDINGNIHQLA